MWFDTAQPIKRLECRSSMTARQGKLLADDPRVESKSNEISIY